MPKAIPTLKAPRPPKRYQPVRERSPEYQERAKFYQSQRWRRFRKAFLRRSPMCSDCSEYGHVTPASEIHHIKKLAESPELATVERNCLPLCKPCHTRRTMRGE